MKKKIIYIKIVFMIPNINTYENELNLTVKRLTQLFNTSNI